MKGSSPIEVIDPSITAKSDNMHWDRFLKKCSWAKVVRKWAWAALARRSCCRTCPSNSLGLQWAIIGAMELEEVEEPIRNLNLVTIVLGLFLSGLVTGAAFLISRSFANPLLDMNKAADKISTGDWSTRVAVDGTDELGQLATAFNRMAINNEEQFWVKSSLSEMTTIIQTSDSPESFAAALIRKLTPLLGCGHGVMFVLDDEDRHFHLLGSYGYKERKNLSHVFALGEGLVGQCALEKKSILLSGVAGDHVRITTGLGESAPLAIMAIPLIFQDHVLAVIELASPQPFSPSHKMLLEELVSTLGLGLENLKRNQRTTQLLQKTQRQAEELDSQSEEMRRANEELQVQSEKVRQANEELQSQNEKVRRANEELEEQSQVLVKNEEELRTQQAALEQAYADLMKTRKEIELKAADLDAANRYKSQFLANMSHELRTPLNSLLILAKGFADNEDGNLTRDQVEAARIMHGSGADLLELINDILDLSKIEAGKMDLHVTAMHVVDFADSIRTQFKHVAQAKNLDWNVTVHKDAPEKIWTDVGKVKQIAKNFLANSFKFTEKGSVSVVFAHREEGGLIFSVVDTGIGIPKNKHRMIFEAFQQADGGTSRKFGGTGLGLSIVRELARLLGGEIRLDSEVGKGSTFSLLLPAGAGNSSTDPGPGSPPPSPATPPLDGIPATDGLEPQQELGKPGKGVLGILDRPVTREKIQKVLEELDCHPKDKQARLLLVEDDPDSCKVTAKILKKDGIAMAVAKNCHEAMQLLRTEPFDCMILDLSLPDCSGFELLEHMAHDLSIQKLPVVIHSGRDLSREEYFRLRHYTDALVTKGTPDSGERLAREVGAFLHQAVVTPPEESSTGTTSFQDWKKVFSNTSILLVDDDVRNTFSLSRTLEKRGINVIMAPDGLTALDLLNHAARPVDAVLMDVMMPGLDGHEVTRRIREKEGFQAIPIIGLSAKTMEEDRQKSLAAGMDRFLSKPVDIEHLLGQLQDLIFREQQ
ncbi:MAG: response regulator [Magnetococcus sp. DMHC-1]